MEKNVEGSCPSLGFGNIKISVCSRRADLLQVWISLQRFKNLTLLLDFPCLRNFCRWLRTAQERNKHYLRMAFQVVRDPPFVSYSILKSHLNELYLIICNRDAVTQIGGSLFTLPETGVAPATEFAWISSKPEGFKVNILMEVGVKFICGQGQIHVYI